MILRTGFLFRRLIAIAGHLLRYRQRPNLLAVTYPIESYHDFVMAHIGYAKPLMFHTPSRPSHNHQTSVLERLPSSYRLRSASRLNHNRSPSGTLDVFLSFSPFSVTTVYRDHMKFHFHALPAHRFSKPPSRFLTTQRFVDLFHSTNTPRVFAFRAFLHTDRRFSSNLTCFCTVYRTSRTSSEFTANHSL